jgi:hypothetical protein
MIDLEAPDSWGCGWIDGVGWGVGWGDGNGSGYGDGQGDGSGYGCFHNTYPSGNGNGDGELCGYSDGEGDGLLDDEDDGSNWEAYIPKGWIVK